MKCFRFLSCVAYSVIDNYVCIDYLGCQSKKLSVMYYDKIYEARSYNESIRIGIPEVLMNIISCNGFMKYIN